MFCVKLAILPLIVDYATRNFCSLYIFKEGWKLGIKVIQLKIVIENNNFQDDRRTCCQYLLFWWFQMNRFVMLKNWHVVSLHKIANKWPIVVFTQKESICTSPVQLGVSWRTSVKWIMQVFKFTKNLSHGKFSMSWWSHAHPIE